MLLLVLSTGIYANNTSLAEASTAQTHFEYTKDCSKWDIAACEKIVQHIIKNGKPIENDEYLLHLKDGTILHAIGNEVIGLENQELSIFFFYKEDKCFKGNLVKYLYSFRLNKEELKKAYTKTEALIKNYNEKLPEYDEVVLDGNSHIDNIAQNLYRSLKMEKYKYEKDGKKGYLVKGESSGTSYELIESAQTFSVATNHSNELSIITFYKIRPGKYATQKSCWECREEPLNKETLVILKNAFDNEDFN